MALRKDVEKRAAELKKALLDKKNQEWAKTEIRKRIAEGKEKLEKLEAKLRDPKIRKTLEKKAVEYKKKALALKVKIKAEAKKAEGHIRRNPKKAVATAAAVGVLVGALWAAFHKKK